MYIYIYICTYIYIYIYIYISREHLLSYTSKNNFAIFDDLLTERMSFFTHLTITDDYNDTPLYFQCTSECALGSYRCPVGSISDTCANCTTNPGICLSYVSTPTKHMLLCPETMLLITYLNMDAPLLMILHVNTHTTQQPWMEPALHQFSSNCTLGISSWPELTRLQKSGNLTFITGRLGSSRVPNIYLTWVCVKGYQPWLERYIYTYSRTCIHIHALLSAEYVSHMCECVCVQEFEP